MNACLPLIVLLLALLSAPLAALADENLTDGDCIKCHLDAVKRVQAKGAAHGAMGCQDCHAEHPPLGSDIIPACSLCHAASESSHYALQGCSGCHHPHSPLEMDFSALAEVKPACLSCHPEQGKEMTEHPSLHAEQDCNACHSAHGLKGGQFSNCLDCHDGHAPQQTNTDCTLCHKPHSPKEVTYNDELPSAQCAPCHEDVATMLAKSKRKHAELNCATCHSGEHMAVTSCDDCHGQPHGVMHQKFPNCVDCHLNPHALAE